MQDVKDLVRRVFEDNLKFSSDRAGRINELRGGQNPPITAIFCSDSRVNEQMLLSEPLGNLFAIENAGNIVYPVMGTVLYGIDHLKTPLLLIVGHTECGAVYAAMGSANLPEDLLPVRRVVEKYSSEAPSDRKKANAFFAEKNVDEQIEWLLQREDVKKLVENGLKIVGMIYVIEPVIEGDVPGRLRVINVNGKKDGEGIRRLLGDVPVGRLSS